MAERKIIITGANGIIGTVLKEGLKEYAITPICQRIPTPAWNSFASRDFCSLENT